VDYNGDGKKDLIVGERNGTIRIYLNTNTDDDPQFNGYTFLRLGAVNYDCGLNSHIFFVDWNKDGKVDLLVGEDGGKVHLLINVSPTSTPVFNRAVWLQDGVSTLTTGNEASPVMVDWNRDGKRDLLCGDYNGNVNYWENTGTDVSPLFNGSMKLKAGGSIIDVVYYARLDVADWNNDGVQDLLVGNRNFDNSPEGYVRYFEAVGPLSLENNRIHVSTGGTIDFSLGLGRDHPNRNYFLLGNVTGTDPGFTLPSGKVFPLNWDFVTTLIFGMANTPAFIDFQGTLDSKGSATAQFNTLGPLSPNAIGVPMRFAFLLYGPYDYVSNAAEIEFLP